jgi:hypothetical protein
MSESEGAHPMTMTSERLAEIEARAAAATPGPWQVVLDKWPHYLGLTPHQERRIFTTWAHPQLKAPAPVVNSSTGIGETRGGPARRMVSIGAEDADFIAAARDDVPDLVAALRAERARAEAAEARVERLLATQRTLFEGESGVAAAIREAKDAAYRAAMEDALSVCTWETDVRMVAAGIRALAEKGMPREDAGS